MDALMDHEAFLELVRYNADGLVPCVVQAADGGEVLMVAYASEEALRATLACRGVDVLESQPQGALAQGRHQR